MRRVQLESRRAARALLTLVVATQSLLACESRRTPYRIGVVLGVDGAHAARLAATEVNARGGIHGRPLELRDLGTTAFGNAAFALATAERLVSDDTVLAVIGHTNSSASLAAAQVYNARGVVQIAPTTSSPLYSNAGAFSFRLVPSDVHQGAFLAEQVIRNATRPRVAMIWANDDYGRALRKVIADRLRVAGITPVYDSPYSEGERFTRGDEIVLGLEHTRPDLLLWIGRSYDYLPVAKAVRRALPSLNVLASDGFGGPELESDVEHLLDGVRYVHTVNLVSADTAMRRFRGEFEREGKLRLTDQAVLAYDAVMLLAEALRHTGPDRVAIRDWLATVGRDSAPFRGLSGPIAFTADGGRAPAYFLEVIGGGIARTSDPTGRDTAGPR